MSIPEQASKVATSTVDALRGSPGLLVLVLLQMTTLGVLYFVNDRQNERRQIREMQMIERCFPHSEKTATVPVRTQPLKAIPPTPEKEPEK